MLSLIACIGKNRELGKDNQLIFHLKDDMHFFRQTTSGHRIIMGRKTWESLPKKLQNRENIVISHHTFPGPDLIVHDPMQLVGAYQNSLEEVFIIGGSSIYKKFLPYAKHLYLTEIDALTPDADAFFPAFDKSEYTKEIIKKGSENGIEYSIVKYIKREQL